MFCGASYSLSGAKHGSAREQTVFFYYIKTLIKKCSRKEPGFVPPRMRIGNYSEVQTCLRQPRTSRIQRSTKPEPLLRIFLQ